MFNKRFIKCIIGAVCIFILVITLIGGKTILEKKAALEVINNFFQSNYEYTKVASWKYIVNINRIIRFCKKWKMKISQKMKRINNSLNQMNQ